MKNKFSIIIPVYNSEKYMNRCLESLVNQTNQNYEIVIIDDASTDKTLDIVLSYQKNNDKIKLYSLEENIGPGFARNVGIDVAKYDNILFCDSDDYYELNLLEKMDEILISNNDIEIIHYKGNVHRETAVLAHYEKGPFILYNDNTIINGKQFLIEKGGEIPGSVYYTLFKKKFLEENMIRFKQSSHQEDLLFMIQALYKAKKIYCINCKLYNRVFRPNSLTTSGQTKKRIEELLYITDEAYQYLKEKKDIFYLFIRFSIWAILKLKTYYDIDYSIETLKTFENRYKDFYKNIPMAYSDRIKETIDELENKRMGKFSFRSRKFS